MKKRLMIGLILAWAIFNGVSASQASDDASLSDDPSRFESYGEGAFEQVKAQINSLLETFPEISIEKIESVLEKEIKLEVKRK